jgi:hypothetical protein
LRNAANVFHLARRELLQLRKGVCLPEFWHDRALHVGDHRLERFFADLGKCPASLTMPPACPPIPSAQVLQAFFERMAFQSFQMPPASRALDQVYRIARHPPPDLSFFMIRWATA